MYRARYLSAARSNFAVALLGVQLNERSGVGKRDKRHLERCLLRGGEVARGEGALESCAGMALRGHEHTFSHCDPPRGRPFALWSPRPRSGFALMP